jgi:hypothetical protein
MSRYQTLVTAVIANYAFDSGVLSIQLTQLIEEKGKHWVSANHASLHNTVPN